MAGERNLTVVVSANIAKLREELAKSDAIIATTTGALKKMSDTYDGSRTIANANAAMLQIQKLGGVTGLTESEQRKLNAQLQEGIAKYASLGKSAPADMVALEQATRKAVAPVESMGTATSSLTDKAKAAAGALGLAFGAGAVLSGLQNLVSKTFEYAGSIDDTSKKLGISVEATQRYKFAAEQTGASLEHVAKSVLALSKNLDGGNDSVKQALKAAGVEFDAIRSMEPEAAFNATVAAIQQIPDPMTQARVAMELFGKGGAEILPAIREGFAEIADSAAVMSDDAVRRLAAAEDAWASLGNTAVMWSGEMLSAGMSAAEVLTRSWTDFFKVVTIAANDGVAAAVAYAAGLTTVESASAKAAKAQEEQAAVLSGSYANAMRNLGPVPPKVKELTEAEVAAQKAADRLAEAFQKQVDVLTGKSLAAEVDRLTKLYAAAEKQGGLTAFQSEKLGKDLFALAQQGATVPPVLAAIVRQYELTQLRIPGVSKATEGYLAFLRQVPSAGVTTVRTMADVNAQLQQMATWAAKVQGGDPTAAVRAAMAAIGNGKPVFDAGLTAGGHLKAGFAKALEGMPAVIVGAIQGGGDVGKALGASVGGQIGASLGSSVASLIGGSLGKALGSLGGPLGSLAGSALGGVIGNLFGSAGRDAVKEFANSMGGFDALRAKLNSLGAEGERLWVALTQGVGRNNPQQAQAAINAITQALGQQQQAIEASRNAAMGLVPSWRDAGEMAKQYGLSVEAIDRAVRQGELTDLATTLYKDFERLSAFLKQDMNEDVLRGMSDEISAMLAQALQFGLDVPREMQPVIARLRDMGLLVDGNGQAFTESQLAGISFADTMESATRDLIATMKELIATITNGVGGALSGMGSAIRGLPNVPLPSMPRLNDDAAVFGGAMATGGSGVVTQPTWFLAGEAGPERYSFAPMRQSSTGGGGGSVVLNVSINHPVVRDDRDIHSIVDQVTRRLPAHLSWIGARG